jgi:hypothetical protein
MCAAARRTCARRHPPTGALGCGARPGGARRAVVPVRARRGRRPAATARAGPEPRHRELRMRDAQPWRRPGNLPVETDMPNRAARRGTARRAFCQVTGFSRPGNQDRHADRLPAAQPGVMVVQTAGNTPEYPGPGNPQRSHTMAAKRKNATPANGPHSAAHTPPSPPPARPPRPRPTARQRPCGPR